MSRYPDGFGSEPEDVKFEISVPESLWAFSKDTVNDIIEYADNLDRSGFPSAGVVLRNCAYLIADLRGRISEPRFGSLVKASTSSGVRMELVRSEHDSRDGQMWSDGFGNRYAWSELLHPVLIERAKP